MFHNAGAASSDPLGRYRHPATDSAGRPIPLTGTRFIVRVVGGLALVTAERRFRNAEAASIEATLTFPVPLHAALVGLTARVDDRQLAGQAKRRVAAREHYEAGISEGRTAVLHEEVLRGVHMVSVGQVRPGGEVTVSGLFAMPLATAPGGAAMLRLPTTVGDIYGRSPLADSDDLVHGPYVHEAEIEVSCLDPGVSARLAEGALDRGRARVRLDAPIDIQLEGAAFGMPLLGKAADGRLLELTIAPAPCSDVTLNATWLLDISGSMASPAYFREVGRPAVTKYDVALRAMDDMSSRLRENDRVELWEFSDTARCVGKAVGPNQVRGLARHVSPLQGGTELGGAISACTHGREGADVLIVTDGQSYALDVHAAARSGARFTVLLVGEEALAANVGHLAALTGGQVFLSSGPDLSAMMELAVASLRAPRLSPTNVEAGRLVEAVETGASGLSMSARWSPYVGSAASTLSSADARAVGAYAAWLALPALVEEDAAVLAEAEGIVSHLTSLVLVDEAGEARDAIPAQRKVELTTPRILAAGGMSAASGAAFSVPAAPPCAGAMDSMPRIAASSSRPAASVALEMGLDVPAFLRRRTSDAWSAPQPFRPMLSRSHVDWDLSIARGRVSWGAEPEKLRAGDLTGLPRDVVAAIRRAGEVESVKSLATALGAPVAAVALALLAKSSASWDNAARRFASAILAGADQLAVEVCMLELGLA